MRIATSNRYDAAIDNLQKRQQDMAESQLQLTSGKRVNVASDDPVAAARAERDLATMARSDANQRALEASRNVALLGEAALGDATELLQQARETMVNAGNGSYTAGERQALAIKLQEIRNQLLTVANRPDGGGGFVFGGQGSNAPPFIDTTAGVTFVGQGGEALAASSERLNLTVDGNAVWLSAKSGNGVFETTSGTNIVTGLPNSGTGWITPGNVSNPQQLPYPVPSNVAPSTYAIEFSVSGGQTTYTILEDGIAMPSATTLPYSTSKSIEIPGRGMSVTVTGVPANGDTFNINQSDNNLSVFDALDEAIAGLKDTYNNTGQVQQLVNRGLSQIDALSGNFQRGRTALGETLNRMDGIESRISSLKLIAQTDRSAAEDLDMVEAISEFQNKQTGYDAALKSYAMVQKLSLFQYVNG